MKKSNKMIWIAVALIIAAVFSRIVSSEMQWHNFAPFVAMGLFGGALFKNKSLAYLLPLGAYFLSDLYFQLSAGTGFYGSSQYFVYGAMILIVLLGSKMGQPKVWKVLGFSIGGTLLFWLVSNFGVFAAGYYGYSFAGLIQTYLMAIPFYTPYGSEMFFNAFIGDIIYSSILFGAYALIKSYAFDKKVLIQ